MVIIGVTIWVTGLKAYLLSPPDPPSRGLALRVLRSDVSPSKHGSAYSPILREHCLCRVLLGCHLHQHGGAWGRRVRTSYSRVLYTVSHPSQIQDGLLHFKKLKR